MEPEEFLQFARALSEREDMRSNASSRTVISRAYYASHHSAMNRLMSIGINPLEGAVYPENTQHKLVIEALREKNDHLGDLLDRLCKKRVAADYFLRARIESRDTTDCLRIADSILLGLPQIH